MNTISELPVASELQIMILHYLLEETESSRIMRGAFKTIKRWSPFTYLGVKLYRSMDEMRAESKSKIYPAKVWNELQIARMSPKMRRRCSAMCRRNGMIDML